MKSPSVDHGRYSGGGRRKMKQIGAALYKLMATQGIFDRRWRQQEPPPVGGESAQADLTAGGRRVAIPPLLEAADEQAIAEVYQAIHALVPEAIWNKLRAQHAAYQQAHPDE